MRKQPKQLRSRLLVKKLIDATGRTIHQRGVEFTTTNHIAEEAGVDIASLYQYFTNKEDLVAALMEDIIDQILKQVADYIASIDMRTIEPDVLIRAVLMLGINAVRANPVIMQLARQSQHLSVNRSMGRLERYAQQLATMYFTQHFRRFPIENLHLRLYIVSISVFATIGRHVSEQSPISSDADLVDALVEMVMPFFEKGTAQVEGLGKA
ncbi:MAG: TetR/AcrR family transcriptional regulator [Pedobacter sp.]|nr:TetR/AcrR family transcriptional regulator [Pedobacter sp.]